MKKFVIFNMSFSVLFHFQCSIQYVVVWVFIVSEVSFHVCQCRSHQIIRVQNSSFIKKRSFSLKQAEYGLLS